MVTQGSDEHLGLVFKTPKRFTMYYTIPVTLKFSTQGRRGLWPEPSSGATATHSERRKPLLKFLKPLTDAEIRSIHDIPQSWPRVTSRHKEGLVKRCSTSAIISLVVSIISGLTETEVIPQATSFSVRSG